MRAATKYLAAALVATATLGSCTENTCACSYGVAPTCHEQEQVYRRQQVDEPHGAVDGRRERIAQNVLDRARSAGCEWAQPTSGGSAASPSP
jgi:hypothetical protein